MKVFRHGEITALADLVPGRIPMWKSFSQCGSRSGRRGRVAAILISPQDLAKQTLPPPLFEVILRSSSKFNMLKSIDVDFEFGFEW